MEAINDPLEHGYASVGLRHTEWLQMVLPLSPAQDGPVPPGTEARDGGGAARQ